MPAEVELVLTQDIVPGHCLKRYTSAAAEGTLGIVVKAAPGKLVAAHMENTSGAALWLMVFDKATAPVNADVPIWRHKVATVASGDLVLPPFGVRCANGISVAVSSTAGSLTLDGASDCLLSVLFA